MKDPRAISSRAGLALAIISAGAIAAPMALAEEANAADGLAQDQLPPIELETTAKSNPANATSEPARNTARVVENIVVTAQKRAQNLADVPMSISAVMGEDLEAQGARTFADYAQTVPGLNFASAGEGQSRFSIRGMSGVTGAPTTGYLVDGVSQTIIFALPNFSSPDDELFDIERIEVLRGPQGTLYGEGAVGGAIKVMTRQPDPEAFEARMLASYDNNQLHGARDNVNAVLNVPLADSLALRATAFRRHADGFITVRQPDFDNPEPFNDFSSEVVEEVNANTTDVHGARVSLAWFPSSTLSLTARYNYNKGDYGYALAVTPSLKSRYGEFNHARGTFAQLVNDYRIQETRQANLTINWELPFATLESISGFADFQFEGVWPTFVGIGSDNAANNLPPTFEFLFGEQPTPKPANEFVVTDMFTVFLDDPRQVYSQELRLASSPGGFLSFNDRLFWTAGLFYKYQDRVVTAIVDSGANAKMIDPLCQVPIFCAAVTLAEENNEYAIYGEAEYLFSDRWSMVLGLRGFRQDRGAVGGTTENRGVEKFEGINPKFGVAFRPNDDVLIYSNVAKGFRAGGINTPTSNPPTSFQPTYEPDSVWSFELGVNAEMFDGQVSASMAVFRANWDNYQQSVSELNNIGQPVSFTTNAGKVHSQGVEWEVRAQLPLNLSWTLGGAFLAAELDEPLANPNPGGDPVPAGTGLPGVPRWSGSSSLSHDATLTNGLRLNSAVVWTYRGEDYFDILERDRTTADELQLFNLRLQLTRDDSPWSATLFAGNLLDADGGTFHIHPQSGGSMDGQGDTLFRVAPRSIGLRLGMDF